MSLVWIYVVVLKKIKINYVKNKKNTITNEV